MARGLSLMRYSSRPIHGLSLMNEFPRSSSRFSGIPSSTRRCQFATVADSPYPKPPAPPDNFNKRPLFIIWGITAATALYFFMNPDSEEDDFEDLDDEEEEGAVAVENTNTESD
eukprot:CAMPEP_0194710770 /NCGR_PEP_ID=MMETSP0296-20130528/3289_1 /TAXON_ID=39354 /ORGANISM="Heterosigma akashiwo, Strain CCMP2393" /LENGTH=113 /DNA_ID=CAMNT_0039608613 /DNA_START=73 /DNA_END=414 /DNA_ORIENTATION=+